MWVNHSWMLFLRLWDNRLRWLVYYSSPLWTIKMKAAGISWISIASPQRYVCPIGFPSICLRLLLAFLHRSIRWDISVGIFTDSSPWNSEFSLGPASTSLHRKILATHAIAVSFDCARRNEEVHEQHEKHELFYFSYHTQTHVQTHCCWQPSHL